MLVGTVRFVEVLKNLHRRVFEEGARGTAQRMSDVTSLSRSNSQFFRSTRYRKEKVTEHDDDEQRRLILLLEGIEPSASFQLITVASSTQSSMRISHSGPEESQKREKSLTREEGGEIGRNGKTCGSRRRAPRDDGGEPAGG